MNAMADHIYNSLKFNFRQILIDEIALNGLEGIGFDLLWKHVEKRISATLTDKLKARCWSFLCKCVCVSFHEVPEARDPCTELLDRFKLVEELTGQLIDPPMYLDGPYEYSPVENQNGSCSNFDTRIEIAREKLAELASYEAVWAEYGTKLVMVASQEERWRALAPHMPFSVLTQLTSMHYCILELVGKSRENGQMTVGNTNLTKIVKEPKFLFYNRKHLQDLDLIKSVCITIRQDRGVKALLLRLKRFHKPSILSMPKVGALFNLREYLLEQPNYCAKTTQVVTQGLITQQTSKRLQKTVNDFKFDERYVQAEPSSKKGRNAVVVKRRFIALQSKSDESSQSEGEEDPPLKCEYKVGVDLFRQAYERFLDSGVKGLTQIELAQLLGVEFYASRTICRLFKSKHIIREHLEDKGKQRTARYFAVAAATGEMDQIYEKEKQKLIEQIKICNKSRKRSGAIDEDNEDEDEDDIPLKKIKLEANQETNTKPDENDVIEIKVLDGLENFNSESLLCSKKTPTLRQLKFANGLLKVTAENQVISGYQTLSSLVSKETGEPPMDTKALKVFVQKLVTDNLLKLMKIRWPGRHQKYSVLICTPTLKCTDPIIKTKQKEISIRAFTNEKVKKDKNVDVVERPLAQYAYPRYMKIQLLHEFLMNLVYFEDEIVVRNLPRGFCSLVSVIPEITVEFAIGNISNLALSEIMHLKVEPEVLGLKLREAPQDVYQNLLQSKSLHSSIRVNLKVLAMLGLIQLINEPSLWTGHSGGLASYVFYMNRQAKILDTTGTWPREDNDALEKTFHFESFSDVKNYWHEVYEISSHTTVESTNRFRKKLTPPLRQVQQVAAHDRGERFGNGEGPCGFDASFYMEQSRLWRTFYSRMIKNKPLRRQPLKKKKKIVPEKKPKKIKVKKIKPKPIVQEKLLVPRGKKRRRKPLSNATPWSDWEDKILMMCKVAITIMSPVSQPGTFKVRNNATKDLLSLFDSNKLGSTIHRRANHLESNLALEHEKECLINELRRRRHLIVKYEGLLRKIRIRNVTNMAKFTNDARTPMLELVWIINQLVKAKCSAQEVPRVATDLKDFHKKYNVCATTANKPCNGYKGDADGDLPVCLVKETIVQSTISTYHASPPADYSKRLYSTLAAFSERTLRIALEQMRKCGAVSCKEKVFNYHLQRFTAHDSVRVSYKVAAAYVRKWINRLNTDFADCLANLLDSNMPETAKLKSSPEMNCLMSELQASGILEIMAETVPVISGSSASIIQEQQLNDIEIKFQLKSGIIGWKNLTDFEQLADCYEHIHLEDFSDTILRNSVVEVSTHQGDEEDIIVRHLREQGERGALLSDLLNHFGDNPAIIRRLEELESEKIIKRVGFFENRIILGEFAKAWTTTVDDTMIIPTPWLSFYFEIRKDIFFKWSGVVMNKVFEEPGCSIAYISNTTEFITTKAVQDICMFLEKCQCMKLRVLKTNEVDLFSDDVPSEFTDFNPYEAPENIYAFPLSDSLTKYAYIRKKILSNNSRMDSGIEPAGDLPVT